jgi:hypothetical protein
MDYRGDISRAPVSCTKVAWLGVGPRLGRWTSHHFDSSFVTFEASRTAAFPMLATFVITEVPASFPYWWAEEFAVTIVAPDIDHGGSPFKELRA